MECIPYTHFFASDLALEIKTPLHAFQYEQLYALKHNLILINFAVPYYRQGVIWSRYEEFIIFSNHPLPSFLLRLISIENKDFKKK
jgi:hypothetical protein